MRGSTAEDKKKERASAVPPLQRNCPLKMFTRSNEVAEVNHVFQ